MKSPTLSRRTIAKGAAWSAPVIIASSTIPAYAASTTEVYGVAVSNSSNSYYSSGCMNSITVTNSQPIGENPAGYAVVYPANQGKDQIATMNSYSVSWYLPSAINGFNVTSGNYTYTGKSAPSSSRITLDDGSSFSTTGYSVFTFTYNGTLDSQTQVYAPSTMSSNSATFFTATSTGLSSCLSSTNYSAATVSSYDATTANGYRIVESNWDRNNITAH